MKKILAAVVAAAAILSAAERAFAETYQLSWDPVVAYADGTAVEAGKSVSYTAYWTTDPSLSAASLKAIASGVTATGAGFDLAAQGMTRGTTVYFTCRASLPSGEISDLSAGYAWLVPARKPSSPGNTKIIRIR
jgi:hypothetical protein